MPTLVEDVPRLEIAQLRELPAWNAIKKAGEAHLILEYRGERIDQRVRLSSDETPWGRRYWFICPGPRCGSSRRRHLYLHGSPGDDRRDLQVLLCRRCCAGGLLYFQQAMPGSRSSFREEMGLPILRRWRATKTASTISLATIPC